MDKIPDSELKRNLLSLEVEDDFNPIVVIAKII